MVLKTVILFGLLVSILVLSLKYEKWYLYIICGLYTILPDTFAIEISTSLPLLTFKRIFIVILFCILLYNNKIKNIIRVPKEIFIYTLINLVVSIINLRFGFGELNGIFIIIFEQFMLVLLIKGFISNKEDVYKCLEFVVYCSVILAIISILQTVVKFDLATVFALTESRVSQEITDRMNTVRAYGVTNAISNGCYISFMVLISIFMYEKTKRFRYIFILALNIIALACTMTRSAILSLGIVIFIMLIVRNRQFIAIYSKYIMYAVAAVIMVIVVKPEILNGVKEVFKSILNVLGFKIELSEEFGMNAGNASYSRMVQWTAIIYMYKEGLLLFGYGYRAFVRGKLFYYFKQFKSWTKATALDTGFVSIAVERGIVGLVNNILLWLKILYDSLRFTKKGKFDYYQLTVYIVILYMLLNIMSAFANSELNWIIIALFFSYRECDYMEKWKEREEIKHV